LLTKQTNKQRKINNYKSILGREDQQFIIFTSVFALVLRWGSTIRIHRRKWRFSTYVHKKYRKRF